MNSIDKLIAMAEDELTQFSTEARKIEKLRPKVGLTVPYPQQKDVKAQIVADIPTHIFAKIVERDRQMVALPFWGIGGLGLLLGISMHQPLDFIATAVGFYVAFGVQSWGWNLEAKRLIVKTLDAIEQDMQSDT
ncbi:hypothetical protein [Leptothoe sp. PORK10 BA2]|uniref:hypothetical protein n=1 Tax=Leptothoe sp. PORK10 BA2 TaxID=3110254 RepID=UPI002B219008|nr:hypothetical protein [Leptothoe sp. PORK10 BA2]MEA5466728.1 hypothetical protein [Leptothoe sp. PORK10 BA2]